MQKKGVAPLVAEIIMITVVFALVGAIAVALGRSGTPEIPFDATVGVDGFERGETKLTLTHLDGSTIQNAFEWEEDGLEWNNLVVKLTGNDIEALNPSFNGSHPNLIYEDMESEPDGNLKNDAVYDSQGWVRLTEAKNSQNGQLEYEIDPGDNFVVEFEFWSGDGTGADAVWFYAFDDNTPASEDDAAGGYHFAFDEYQDEIQLKYDGGSLENWLRSSIDDASWHDVEIIFFENQSGHYFRIDFDGDLYEHSDIIRNISGGLFGWGARTSDKNNQHRIRDLSVRPYVEPEPSPHIYSESKPQYVEVGENEGPEYSPRLFGTLEFYGRGWFHPDRTFIYEGGALLENQEGGLFMSSTPNIVTAWDADGDNIVVKVNYVFINSEFSSVSLGSKNLEIQCMSSYYRASPDDKPNRERVVVDLRDAIQKGHESTWKSYLKDLENELSEKDYNAELDGLKLTINGKGTGKDIYYYERVKEIVIQA